MNHMISCIRFNRFSSANIRFLLYRHTIFPLLNQPPFPIAQPPVVIGAMGGSGTRLSTLLLQLAGFWMGAWISHKTQDSMAPRYLLQTAFSRLIEAEENPDERLAKQFSRLIHAHRLGMPDPDGAWGWKNPRSIWIIPFLARIYPDMKFIHMIRDGRDMALSNNRNLLHKHGAYLLGQPDCVQNTVRSQFRLWAIGNRKAWDDGQKYLGKNYLLLHYEKLCQHPKHELNRIYRHIGIEPDDHLIDAAQQLIVPESNVSRWRKSGNSIVLQPEAQLREALGFFGYE